jgi:hypothetical protein
MKRSFVWYETQQNSCGFTEGYGTEVPLLCSVGGVGQRIQKDKASISRGLFDARVCQAIGADLAPPPRTTTCRCVRRTTTIGIAAKAASTLGRGRPNNQARQTQTKKRVKSR